MLRMKRRGDRRVGLMLGICGWAVVCASAIADEWAHYRGPQFNGVSQETGWVVPSGPLSVLWKSQVGIGTSSVTASAGRIYTMGHEGEVDVIRCLDAANGNVIWHYELKVSLDPNLFEGGTRSTPTLFGGFVYTVSHEGHLICFEAQTGKVVWQHHLVNEFAGRKPEWGFSGAPLVSGDLLIMDVGGDGASTMAFHRRTGEVVWKAGADKAGYACPVVLPLEGQPTLLVFKSDHLVASDPKDGRELWRFPWKTNYDINAATPFLLGLDRLLISSGYNAGVSAILVEGGKPRQLWKSSALRAHINSPTIVNGFVYGVDGNTGGGNLVCLDPATGAKRWEEKSVKGGALICADGKLVIVSEKGDLIFAEANPAGFKQINRQTVLFRRTWAQPTLSDGRLFLRDNLGMLVCLDLRP